MKEILESFKNLLVQNPWLILVICFVSLTVIPLFLSMSVNDFYRSQQYRLEFQKIKLESQKLRAEIEEINQRKHKNDY